MMLRERYATCSRTGNAQRGAAPDDAEADLRAGSLVVDDRVLPAVDDRDLRRGNLDVVAGEERHRHHEPDEPQDDRQNDRGGRKSRNQSSSHSSWRRASGPLRFHFLTRSTSSESPASAVITTPAPGRDPLPVRGSRDVGRSLAAQGQGDLAHSALRECRPTPRPSARRGPPSGPRSRPAASRGSWRTDRRPWPARFPPRRRSRTQPGGTARVARDDAADPERGQEGADDPGAEDAGPVAVLQPACRPPRRARRGRRRKRSPRNSIEQEKQKPEGADGRIEEHGVTLSPVSVAS